MSAQPTDEIFVVDDDIFTSSEPHVLTEAEAREAGSLQQLHVDEIIYTAAAVARQFKTQCPMEVVNSVLAFAGVLLSFEAESTERHRGHSNMNDDYVTLTLPTREELQLPDGVSLDKCVLVVADCTSRDQGWASDGSEHNGTYRACWSWNELAVSKRSADGEASEAVRVRFCPNLRANRDFRHHRKYMRSPNELVENIALGDTVRIVLRSQYPGWSNTASYGRLVVSFAVEFDDEFAFTDVPFPEISAAVATSPIVCSLQ